MCCDVTINGDAVNSILNIQGGTSLSAYGSMGSLNQTQVIVTNAITTAANTYPDNPNAITYAKNAAQSAISAGYSSEAATAAAAAAAAAGVLSEQVIIRDRIRGSASTAIPSTAATNAGSSAANAYISTAASGSPSIQSKCADLQMIINSYMNDINEAKKAQSLTTQTSLTTMLCTFRAAFSSLYCNTFGSRSSGSGSSPKELPYPTTGVRGTLIYEPANQVQMLTITTDTDVGDYIQNGDALYLGFGSEKQGPFYVVEQYTNIDVTITKFNDTNLAMRNSVEFPDIVKSLLTQTSSIPQLTDPTFVSLVIRQARANFLINLSINQINMLSSPLNGDTKLTNINEYMNSFSKVYGFSNEYIGGIRVVEDSPWSGSTLVSAVTELSAHDIYNGALRLSADVNNALASYITTITSDVPTQNILRNSAAYANSMLASINPNNITQLYNSYIQAGSQRALANSNMIAVGSANPNVAVQNINRQNTINTLSGSVNSINLQATNTMNNALTLEGSFLNPTLWASNGSFGSRSDVLRSIFTLSLAQVDAGSGSTLYSTLQPYMVPPPGTGSGSGSGSRISSSSILNSYINLLTAYSNLMIQSSDISNRIGSLSSAITNSDKIQNTYNSQYQAAVAAFNRASDEYTNTYNTYNTVITGAGAGISTSTLQTAYNNLQNISGQKAQTALNTAKTTATELASMGVTPTTTRANIPALARRTTTFRISIGTNAVTSMAGIPKPSITKSIINQPLSVAKLMGISTTTVKQSGLGENILPKDISGTYFINGRLFNIDSNGGLPNNLNVGDLVYLVGDDHRSSELISKEFLLDKTKSELNQLTEYNNTFKELPEMYRTINGSTGVTTVYQQQTTVEDNKFYLNSTWGGPNIWSGGSSVFADAAMAAGLESQIGPTVAAGIENIKNTRPSVTLGPFAIGASPTVNMIVFRGIKNQELDLFVNSPGLNAIGELIQGPVYESFRLDNVKLYRPIHSEPKFLCKNIKGMGGGSIQ